MALTLDVFLSFRGLVTRTSFTNHLYNALQGRRTCSFSDHEKRNFAVVEGSDSSQLKCIEETMLCIIVFSEDYPSSSWCLDELSHIMNHCSEQPQIRTHVIYRESPFVTRNVFYFGKKDLEKLPRWRVALTEGANMTELRNILSQPPTVGAPRSSLCCYVDYVLHNRQEKKGSSGKPSAAADANAILKVLDLIDLEDTSLCLPTSTRQLQLCDDSSLHGSKILCSSNPRDCESMAVKLSRSYLTNLLGTSYMWSHGSNSKANMKRKIIHQSASASPAPFRDFGLTTAYTARKTSVSVLLVTICVVSTFLAALGFSSTTFREDYLNGRDAITSRSIIAINSLLFIVSMVTDMFLLQTFAHKRELQISLFALFGAYICLIKATIPQAALPLFLISIPFLLVAAVDDTLVNNAVSS